MKASSEIKAYIKRKEGCAQMRPDGRIDAYLCPAKVWTIGYGTTRYPTGVAVKQDDIITPKQAEDYFEHDIAQFQEQVTRLVKVRLTQGQFDALVSFIYNIGGNALEESTLLKKLNKSDYRGAAEEFLRWDKITNRTTGKEERLRGLSDRRAHEKRIFKGGDNQIFYPDSNNTPLRNRDLPLPTVMRDNADDPLDGDFDEYTLKLHEKFTGAAVEWADAVLLVKKKMISSEKSPNGKIQGETVLYAENMLGTKTKNRLGLPKEVPCNWNSFISAIGTNPFNNNN